MTISRSSRPARFITVSLPPFQTLLDAHGLDVHRFLLGMVGSGAAEDCFQETWLAALRGYPELRDARNLRGWLFTIAHRKALDHHRRARRDPLPAPELPEAAGERPPEADGALWASVRALPEKQRGAVVLRYVLDLGYEEIARSLECSPEAARRSAHEGVKRLRREWSDGAE